MDSSHFDSQSLGILPSSQAAVFSPDNEYVNGLTTGAPNFGSSCGPGGVGDMDLFNMNILMMQNMANASQPSILGGQLQLGGQEVHVNLDGSQQHFMTEHQQSKSTGVHFSNQVSSQALDSTLTHRPMKWLLSAYRSGLLHLEPRAASQFGDITNLARPAVNFAANTSRIDNVSASDMARLRADLEETKKTMAAAVTSAEEKACKAQEAAERAEAQMRLEREAQNEKADHKNGVERNKAQALLHEVAKGLLGMTGQRMGERELLPAPLEPGEEAPTAEDGNKLWRPSWNQPPSYVQNKDFFTEVVRKAKEQDKVICSQQLLAEHVLAPFTDAELMAMVKAYFKTLRRKYHAQVSSDEEEKHEKHCTGTRCRNRQKKTVGRLRGAIDEVEKRFGEEKTHGLRAIIHSDHVLSEHSDCGNVEKEKFEKYRTSEGGGSNSLEVRLRQWHSAQIQRIYALLHTFSLRHDRKLGNARKAVRMLGKGSRAGKTRFPRFKCNPANVNKADPALVDGQPPFAWMVDEEWLKRNPNFRVLDNPENFTIFDLEIPDNELD
ncbi:hypothetical protein DFH07DRAFT_777272 [Mycena maculata]|uniref:Uncharacterized protein n=1 Tax=Mycena maculata TaxID=230809 RepID=A0AAD7IIM5_9AGAR|nr:hypothetical protein DFH07DRAFT_777272 [Mycena maculata]